MKPYVLATAINQGMDVRTSVLNGFSPLWVPPDWQRRGPDDAVQQPKPPPRLTDATSQRMVESPGDAS